MTPNLKKTMRAAGFCVLLLLAGFSFLFHTSHSRAAKEDPFAVMLKMPAPPPPNPLISGMTKIHDENFFRTSNPPKDNAPIRDLLDYWERQSLAYQPLRYRPEPSDATLARLMKEIDRNPALLTSYLNLFRNNAKGADFVKEHYDRAGVGGVYDKETRKAIKSWLTYNSPYFSSDLMRGASSVTDTDEYVSSQEELLALARVDFDKAKPIIDRLNGDTLLKTSRVLAKWALYRHALYANALGDIEEYRDQLKAVVEDKNAIPGMRDLAMDALASEKEWSGRDEWYYSLLGDESLASLKVNGQENTGLTTLMMASPDDKYIDKMLEFARNDNPTIRSAAVRNLITRLNSGNPDIIKALLPWLDDPKWAVDRNDARGTLIRKLSELEIPESVPGLIKVIDEKQAGPMYANIANTMANAANAAANMMAYAANAAANRPATNAVYYNSNTLPANTPIGFHYPNRYSGVLALAKQKDARAVPRLRHVLTETKGYEASSVVGAILACGGYSIAEQLAALDVAAKGVKEEIDVEEQPVNVTNANVPLPDYVNKYANEAENLKPRPPTAAEIRKLLGQQLTQSAEITDALARAIVDRIEILDKQDPPIAGAYRRMILRWQNAAINIMLLRDVKRGTADADTIIRLLGQRKELREKQSTDIFDIRTGKPSAFGVSACLLEDVADFNTILDSDNAEMKIAMLACARLLRIPLPVAKVSENLKANGLLTVAAERYIESEDSPEARGIVLARHPNEAKILGARAAFIVDGSTERYNEYLWAVYQSIGNDSLYNGWYGAGNEEEILATEKSLQAEVKKTDDLVGIYAYDGNYIRIYKDRVIFSWDEDESRYRERPMTKHEFDEIKAYFTTNRVDELPPFLACGGDYCTAKELVMLSRNGGRRVYVTDAGVTTGGFEFFTGLEKYFADLKQTPATLKYQLSREIPGLEVVLASDDLHAATVWKDGADLRVVASETAVRTKVKTEIDDIDEDGGAPPTDEYLEIIAKKQALREKTKYQGYSWYKITDGRVDGIAAQPPQVEFIPIRDPLAVQPSDESWKMRAAGIEIRTSSEGLFKVIRGKLIRVRDGNYQDAVITPNGRWVVARKVSDELGNHIVRVDLATNKEYDVIIAGYGELSPEAYVPTLNKVLVIRDDYRYDEYQDTEEDDNAPADASPEGMILVDPATGITQPVAGEFRPVAQQTFRQLQKAAKPNEYWVALIDEERNTTEVGIFETKTFGFKSVLRVPKIRFNSMSMWVDETGKKVYFVYRGHLLSLPLP